MTKKTEDETEDTDATYRAAMSEEGFDPDADGVRFGQVKPKILMPGVYDTVNKAAKAGKGKGGQSR